MLPWQSILESTSGSWPTLFIVALAFQNALEYTCNNADALSNDPSHRNLVSFDSIQYLQSLRGCKNVFADWPNCHACRYATVVQLFNCRGVGWSKIPNNNNDNIRNVTGGYCRLNKKHLKNVGPIRHCEPPHNFTFPFTRCRYCRHHTKMSRSQL